MAAPALNSSRRSAHFGVLALTVIVFGAAVAVVTLQLRAGLREQIVLREAGWLEAIASMQLADMAEKGGEPIESVPGALFVAVLKTQKLAGVSGLRVYDAKRHLSDTWMLPETWMLPQTPESSMAALWTRLASGKVFGKLHTHVSRPDGAEFFLESPVDAMMEAWVPLRRTARAI
jgi:hypothetical protein